MTALLIWLWWRRWRLLPKARAVRPSPLLAWAVRRWCPWLMPCGACGLLSPLTAPQAGWWQCGWCGFALPLRDGDG